MPETWTDVNTGKVLADVLSEYDIVVDDRCEFARIKDYTRGISFWYRAHAYKITLTLWKIHEL